jgi:hypothetical protein
MIGLEAEKLTSSYRSALELQASSLADCRRHG